MTDSPHDEADPAASTGGNETPTVPELLLALQRVDTEADQLAHRRANSTLRADFETRSEQVKQWEHRRADLRGRIDGLAEAIAGAETRNTELVAHRDKLEQQLKTVIAPREAEALMHEIATIESQRDALDIEELDALEQQATLDDELSAHLSDEEAVRSAARLADESLGVEVAEIDAAVAGLAARREQLRADLPASLLATYDRKRAALGVAVATLVGRQCQGCHLELSAAEIDSVREDAAATGVTDCPDCGRLLIV